MNDKALLSTSNFVYLVDLTSGEYVKIAWGQGLYYGITWDINQIYVLCDDYHPFIPKWNRTKILTLDHLLRKKEEITPRFSVKGGVHQAHFDPRSGRLLCMFSKDNSAVIYRNGIWEKWHPLKESLVDWKKRLGYKANKRWDQPNSDVHHLNSIWINNGKIYIVAHNWGPSELYVFDEKTEELQETLFIGKGAHNVWVEDNDIYLCSSGHGDVIDMYGNVLYSTKGFVRGVAVTDKYRVFGLSAREDRKNRAKTDGAIHILTKDWRFLKQISFEQCGQVLEIRILSPRDICHNGLVPPVDKTILESNGSSLQTCFMEQVVNKA
jgi:hypothetical protein